MYKYPSSMQDVTVVGTGPALIGEEWASLPLHDFDETDAKDVFAGFSSPTVWLIKNITIAGKITSQRYAFVENNPAYTDYQTAWTNRATLTYEHIEDINF